MVIIYHLKLLCFELVKKIVSTSIRIVKYGGPVTKNYIDGGFQQFSSIVGWNFLRGHEKPLSLLICLQNLRFEV